MSEATSKAKRRYRVAVDPATCDGCGVCIFFCKPDVFELSADLNRRGVYPAEPVNEDACNNCRLCELGCPQLSICVWPADPTGGGA